MEKLFDLLIILFIIYAFLSPFLKKKPPVRQSPKPYEPEPNSSHEEEKSSQEILREIEELFGYQSKEPEKSETENDEEFHQVIPETQKVEETFQKFDKEHSTTEVKIPVLGRKAEAEKSETQIETQSYNYEETIPEIEIDEFDYSKLDDYEQAKINLNQPSEEKSFSLQLNEIDDFKKAIIYKEIFDTPIALRMRRIKWQRNIY